MPLLETLWQPEDIARLAPTSETAYELAGLPPPRAWKMTEAYSLWHVPCGALDRPLSWTLLGCYGVIVAGNHGHCLVLCGTPAKDYAQSFVRTIRRTMAREAAHHQIEALYAETRVSFRTGARFLELLGFEARTMLLEGPDDTLYIQYRWSPEKEHAS